MPDGGLALLSRWMEGNPFELRVTNRRRTKHGDFRKSEMGYRISVNSNLNPYDFFLTLLHEYAHLLVHKEYGSKVKSHGTEWKRTYGQLILSSIDDLSLPTDIERAWVKHALNPKATVAGDAQLARAMRQYDEFPKLTLEELGPGDEFLFNSRKFKILRKNRSRYLCVEEASGRKYTLSQLAEVERV